MNIDLRENLKQAQLLNTVLEACLGKNDYRYILMGGSIRGGKTFGVLIILTILCKMYPKSKWIIYREDFPALEKTTIPSMEKIVGENKAWTWHRDKSNYYIEYENGSRIFFHGENLQNDKTLNSLLGLETNGVFLEQCEELSEILFNLVKTRLGSNIINPMPPPFMFLTCNPSQNWSKTIFYEPWSRGELKAPYYFIQTLPYDNPYNTEDQYNEWERLDKNTHRQWIEGDWTDLRSKDNLWAYAFDRKKHVVPSMEEPNRNKVLYLSFDFNINPIVCSIIQHYDKTIFVHETIALKQSDIYKLCDQIKVKYKGYVFNITGDSTGSNSTALVRDAWNYYSVIINTLKISDNQKFIPTINPRLEENQVLVNSLFQNYNVKINAEKCKDLIYDLENCRVTPEGGIEKKNRTDLTQRADCLDSLRYYMNTFHRNFILSPF